MTFKEITFKTKCLENEIKNRHSITRHATLTADENKNCAWYFSKVIPIFYPIFFKLFYINFMLPLSYDAMKRRGEMNHWKKSICFHSRGRFVTYSEEKKSIENMCKNSKQKFIIYWLLHHDNKILWEKRILK